MEASPDIEINGVAGIVNKNGTVNCKNVNVTIQNEKEKRNTTDFKGLDLPRSSIKSFKGRNEEIKKLDQLFFKDNVKKVAISGLAGYGKTELARKFAIHCKTNGKIDKVFWIDAGKEECVRQLFINLAELLEMPKIYTSHNQDIIFRKLVKYRCMFIFDDTFNRRSIMKFEPPDEFNHYLLITSRIKYFGNDIHSFPLDPLTTDSSVEVLQTILTEYYKEEDQLLYRDLAEVVGNIPLGLQIFAAHIRHQISRDKDFNLQQYIKKFKEEKTYINAKFPNTSANLYDKTLYEAYKISLDRIHNNEDCKSELTLKILYVCAFLDSENILLDDLNNIFIKECSDENILRQALYDIDDLRVINYDSNQIRIPIFTQEILRHHLRVCDADMQTICYHACLDYLFDNYLITMNILNYRLHCIKHKIILKYADDNETIFKVIYTDYKKKFSLKKVFNNIKLVRLLASLLIQWECIKCLTLLLDDFGNGDNICCKCNSMKRKHSNIMNFIKDYYLVNEAASFNKINVLSLLLQEYGADINNKDKFGDTPLMAAAFDGNLAATELLVQENADVNARNKRGNTALFEFLHGTTRRQDINLDEVDTFFRLLNYKNNKDMKNDKGQTLLHVAGASCHANLIILLATKYNMDINAQDKFGSTVLHHLIFNKNRFQNNDDLIRAVLILKSNNAHLDIKDKEGYTPVELARKEGCVYLIPYLQETNDE